VAGKVHSVKKGQRKNQKRGSLNLQQKTKTTDNELWTYNSFVIRKMELPKGWHFDMPQSDLACFYRRDPFEFNGQRLTLELVFGR